MADPNFLAVVLACVLPLVVNWRFRKLRWPATVIIGAGVYATDSRSGLLLAVVALALSMVNRPGGRAMRAKGYAAMAAFMVCVVALFALDVGGQRDRVVEGVLIGLGIQASEDRAHQDIASVLDRRELLLAWVDVGMDSLPFGSGIAAQDKAVTHAKYATGAHNTFVHALGQGGVSGLLIDLVILLCLACFIRRRTEPFAIMGIVIIAGGLVLSYPGLVFVVLPMGLADGIRAAGLGSMAGRGVWSPAAHVGTDVQAPQGSLRPQ
jgi:hypothetical protein